MSFPLREHRGVTAKESRRLGENRNFVKNEEEYEGEVTAISVDARDTTIATIFPVVRVLRIYIEPASR